MIDDSHYSGSAGMSGRMVETRDLEIGGAVQRQEVRVPVAGVVLWFLLLLTGACFFPAGLPCHCEGWFRFSLSCLFWLVCGVTSLALVADFLAQEIKPLVGADAEDYVLIVGLGLVCLGLSAWSHHLKSKDLASQGGNGEQVKIERSRSRYEQKLMFYFEQKLSEEADREWSSNNQKRVEPMTVRLQRIERDFDLPTKEEYSRFLESVVSKVVDKAE